MPKKQSSRPGAALRRAADAAADADAAPTGFSPAPALSGARPSLPAPLAPVVEEPAPVVALPAEPITELATLESAPETRYGREVWALEEVQRPGACLKMYEMYDPTGRGVMLQASYTLFYYVFYGWRLLGRSRQTLSKEL